MTREELREHCKKQIRACVMRARRQGEKPSGKVYEEHKLILELLEQEPRWIPISEKLPDAGEVVLVTVNLGSARVVEVDMYSLVEKDGFEGYGKDVIAWMSLPQAYSEVEE